MNQFYSQGNTQIPIGNQQVSYPYNNGYGNRTVGYNPKMREANPRGPVSTLTKEEKDILIKAYGGNTSFTEVEIAAACCNHRDNQGNLTLDCVDVAPGRTRCTCQQCNTTFYQVDIFDNEAIEESCITLADVIENSKVMLNFPPETVRQLGQTALLLRKYPKLIKVTTLVADMARTFTQPYTENRFNMTSIDMLNAITGSNNIYNQPYATPSQPMYAGPAGVTPGYPQYVEPNTMGVPMGGMNQQQQQGVMPPQFNPNMMYGAMGPNGNAFGSFGNPQQQIVPQAQPQNQQVTPNVQVPANTGEKVVASKQFNC